MKDVEPFENADLKHLQLFFYFLPVIGFFPALWMLYRRQGDRAQKTASRLAVTLALGWLFGYILLGFGAQTAESLSLPLLLMSSLLTSGYFLVNIWLMVRIWRRKSLKLPVISRISEQLPW